jgi:hypothetical protein
MIMSRERRQYPRIKIKIRIDLSFGRETLINGVCLNIGEGGIFCETKKYLDPYTGVNLMISLPEENNSHVVSCEGIVIRTEKRLIKNRAAIEIKSIEDKDRKRLRNYISTVIDQEE